MPSRETVYFVSDVHLGLDVLDPEGRERRFVQFLRSIPPADTRALYLLGDIWDFWYEYRDVVPRGYVRVFSALMDLMDAGVEVFFFIGNHDIWCYSYLQSLGIKVIKDQPLIVDMGGRTFCLAHGDGLGPGMRGYKLMNSLFKSRPVQLLFSSLHPYLAFRLGNGWSRRHRLSHEAGCRKYRWKGSSEPLYRYAARRSEEQHIDFFIFGHLHVPVNEQLPSGARLMVLNDWLESSDYLYFDGISVGVGHSMKME